MAYVSDVALPVNSDALLLVNGRCVPLCSVQFADNKQV